MFAVALLAGAPLAQADELPAEARAIKQACARYEDAALADMLAAGNSRESLEEDIDQLVELAAEEPRNDALEMIAIWQARQDEAQAPHMICLHQQRLHQLSADPGMTTSPSEHTAAPASRPIAGNGDADAAHCDLDVEGITTGTLSTESATLVNGCDAKVSYVYCVMGADGGGAFSCEAQKFGTGSANARGRSGISVMGAKQPLQVYWALCTATASNPNPLAVKPHWDGKSVKVVCH